MNLCRRVYFSLYYETIYIRSIYFFPYKNGDIYLCQEEDLFIMAYGLPLSGDGDERCSSMLNAVEETISRQLRACKASSSKRRVSEGNYLLDLQHYFGEVLYHNIVISFK